jgi:threonine aldolase
MTRRTIDLRSDTVTRPSPEMRQAMAAAEVDDDVLGHDPTVLRLERRAAELFGKEAALFFPSGTMCNQAAVHALTQRGDEVFLHAQAHILFYEQGGAAVHSQAQLRCFDSSDGTLDLDKMEEYVHSDDDVHFAPTRLVCLENTHNHCGGVVVPLEHMRAVRTFCDRHDLRLHLDGARIWNAAAAAGVTLAEMAAPCDTVSVCLSKGLGAPVGSLLLADEALLVRLRRARKVFGGGMRQAGIIAAGGLYALEHNVERVADDHRRARALAERLARAPGLSVDLAKVQTNMVFAGTRGAGTGDAGDGGGGGGVGGRGIAGSGDVFGGGDAGAGSVRTSGGGLPAAMLVERLAAEGVLALDEAPYSVRFVTHLDVDDADVEEAGEVVARVVEELTR